MNKELCLSLIICSGMFFFGCAADSSKTYAIGETGPAGGLIFYDKGSSSDDWRYLEAAPSDQSTSTPWWGGSSIVTGATDTAIGAGKSNTVTIINSLSTGNYAALICKNTVLNGYNDWFLPSKEEAVLMLNNLANHGSGNFHTATVYWSSSEISPGTAWDSVTDGINGAVAYSLDKSHIGYVRAVRRF